MSAWAIIELSDTTKIVGRLSEAQRFGRKLARVDPLGDEARAEYLDPDRIARITTVTEDEARNGFPVGPDPYAQLDPSDDTEWDDHWEDRWEPVEQSGAR